MIALGKLLRTTAFKLSAIYLVLFMLFAGVIIGYVAWNTHEVVDSQIRDAIDSEMKSLSAQYRMGGLRRLVAIIDRRTREPGASLYLVTNFAGQYLAGNVDTIPLEVLDRPGIHEIRYYSDENPEAHERKAMAYVSMLPGGFRVMVGHDLGERERLDQVIRKALLLSLGMVTLLACIGGWFIMRGVLKRVDAMTDTARTIMAGDLGGRLVVSGNGDELDRLALNLNAMLDRIGELMAGMREVSDNIAHDLKTPLTRLRNHAEEALRSAKTTEDYARALEATIEDSDNLIRIFNALLMIARLEAGNAPSDAVVFDVANTVRSVAELYEAAADAMQITIAIDICDDLPMPIYGSRELVGQALANLFDNALKYGTPDGDKQARISISVHRKRDEQREFAIICVSDNGPGIPRHERARALERFVRLESSRTKPGFGLGLSLVSAVVHMHNGSISLDDNAPGLCVRLTLPITQEGVLVN